MRTVNVIEAIYFAALEKKASAERLAYLDEACKGDEVLRRCVDRMLDSSGRIGNFLQPDPKDESSTVEHPPIEERPGSIIGPYKLLQELGEGGFGVVFMAEQTEPVRRKVALKVIKPGMDSKQVVARFEAERQVLALMDHPNIARVLDGGTTDSGRPYFVMELVKGTPITEFCDQNRLTPRERLELFIPVCQAVQHAHQKGVIHRDLKPSNVLVTLYDDRPVPKVIDFGIAKAIEQKLTEQTLFTRVGQVIGTLEYMSPEQASLNALDVDTRADVYALGVLLYELLTGTTPLDKERLQGVAFLEMLRLIREEEPPKPSTRLSQSAGGLAVMAAYRKTDSQKLPRLVRGELDWIALKALEKDRGRRYATANALARDVQRYLNDEQVEACPPSVGYRFRKYVRRHRTAVVMGGMAAALLLLGALLSGWQALRATQAEAEALQERDDALQARQAEADQRAVAVAAQQKAQEERDAARAEREKVRRLHYTAALNLIPAAWEADNVGRVLELLDEQRPKADEADLRGFEWHYWDRQYHAELRTLHLDGNGETFSGDGARVAYLVRPQAVTGKGTASPFLDIEVLPNLQGEVEAVVKVRDIGADREISSWKVKFPNGGRGQIQLNRDGTRLAAMFRRLVVWDVASGKELFSKELPSARLNFLPSRDFALSPDGKLLATGEHRARPLKAPEPAPVQIWQVDDPTRAPITLASSGAVDYLHFSPDCARLAGALGGSGFGANLIRLWDTATGEPRAEVPVKYARDLAFSPDGTRLATVGVVAAIEFSGVPLVESTKTQIQVWDCTSPKGLTLLHTTAGYAMPANVIGATPPLAFSPDGRLLVFSDSYRHSVRILETATGQEHQTVRSNMAVYAVAFSADGARVLASGYLRRGEIPQMSDSAVREWAVQPLKERALPEAKLLTEAFVWSPDGSRQAVFSGNLNLPIPGQKGPQPSPEGKATQIRIHDRAGKQILVFSEHTSTPLMPEFSPDGRLVSSSAANGEVKIWESDSGRIRWEANLKTLLPDATKLVSPDWTASIAFSPDGSLVTLPTPLGVKIVSTADFREKFTVAGTGPALFPYPACFFSPDSRRLVIGDCPSRLDLGPKGSRAATVKRQLKVLDVDADREIESTTYDHRENSSRAQVTFSPNSRFFALSLPGPGAVTLFEASTGKERAVVKAAVTISPLPPTVVFSPDGDRVVVLSRRGPALTGGTGPTVWETATGKLLFRLEPHANAVIPQVVFSPDGRRIATGKGWPLAPGESASITLWDAATGRELLSLKHPQIGGSLSFSPDGHRLLLQTRDGQGLTWDATPREAAKQQ